MRCRFIATRHHFAGHAAAARSNLTMPATTSTARTPATSGVSNGADASDNGGEMPAPNIGGGGFQMLRKYNIAAPAAAMKQAATASPHTAALRHPEDRAVQSAQQPTTAPQTIAAAINIARMIHGPAMGSAIRTAPNANARKKTERPLLPRLSWNERGFSSTSSMAVHADIHSSGIEPGVVQGAVPPDPVPPASNGLYWLYGRLRRFFDGVDTHSDLLTIFPPLKRAGS